MFMCDATEQYNSRIFCRAMKSKRSDYMCYANSKLLLMMFCGELQRRLRSAGSSIDCMSSHPGISSTDIFRKEDKSKPSANVLNVLGNNVLARIQPPERGCHSMLYAATESSLTGASAFLLTACCCSSQCSEDHELFKFRSRPVLPRKAVRLLLPCC